jgi:hypothetical protein
MNRTSGPKVLSSSFGSSDLDHHLRWPVRARPHHAAVGADVAGRTPWVICGGRRRG